MHGEVCQGGREGAREGGREVAFQTKFCFISMLSCELAFELPVLICSYFLSSHVVTSCPHM